MVAELLGLNAVGFANRLNVHRPLLPDGVEQLTLHDIRVGNGAAALRFQRCGATIETEIVAASGGLEVAVD